MKTSRETKAYVGIFNDHFGGMTETGKIVRDGWIFGFIDESETCEGWKPQGLEDLWRKTSAEWEQYGFMMSNLPPEIKERFIRIQNEALSRAKELGWAAESELDEDR